MAADLFDDLETPPADVPAVADARATGVAPSPEPGVYYGLPDEVYHRDPAWAPLASSSKARTLTSKTPEDLAWEMEHPKAESDEMRFGTAFHVKTLQPERFDDLVVVAPFEKHPGGRSQDWLDFLDGVGERTLLRPWMEKHDLDLLDRMVQKATTHPHGGKWLEGGREVSIVWDERGVRCKARIDVLNLIIPMVVDLKSTRDANRRWFERQAHDLGYHIQGAFYRRAAQAAAREGWIDADPKALQRYGFVAVENHGPAKVACIELPQEDLARGDGLVDRALDLWKLCTETGNWPGYGDEPLLLGFNKWARAQDDHLLEQEIDNVDI